MCITKNINVQHWDRDKHNHYDCEEMHFSDKDSKPAYVLRGASVVNKNEAYCTSCPHCATG